MLKFLKGMKMRHKIWLFVIEEKKRKRNTEAQKFETESGSDIMVEQADDGVSRYPDLLYNMVVISTLQMKMHQFITS
ncbi:hypothetical protein M5689_018116 [Euphorbia peplus]|nr:hypothetical protein M5689_018116 [Euphorbia peplus]